MSFERVYMRIFDAHIYALLLNTIYMGTKHAYIHIGTKHAYTHIYAYKTRIYLRTKHAYICVPVAACLIGGYYQFDAKDFDQ